MTDGAEMQQWVIYDHPRDFPEHFVVRRWLIRPGRAEPTDEVWLRPTLDEARAVVNALFPDGYRLGRWLEDDPVIIEVWT